MEEGGYMMSNIVQRILHVIYPAIVFSIAFLVWSSSDLAEVARFTPPPINDGFNLFSNPNLSGPGTCSSKNKNKIKLRQVCSTFEPTKGGSPL